MNAFWEDETQLSLDYTEYVVKRKGNIDDYKYHYDSDACISFEEIDRKLSADTAEEKIKYLDFLYYHTRKNRFIHETQ